MRNNGEDYFEVTRRGSSKDYVKEYNNTQNIDIFLDSDHDSESLELLSGGNGYSSTENPEKKKLKQNLKPIFKVIIELSIFGEVLMAFYIPLWFSMVFEGKVQPHLIAAVVVATFNLIGCFAEGVGKAIEEDSWLESATIASATNRYSLGFRNGILTVITSFPDIAECGKDLVNWSRIIFLGVVYCWGIMIFGTYLYRQGRFYGKNHRKSLARLLLTFGPASGQLCAVTMAVSIVLAVWNPSFLKIGSATRPQKATGFVFGIWTPELQELIVGSIFSAGGALCSFYLSEVVTDKPVLGRFMTNVVSIAMVVLVRFIYYLFPSTIQSIILAKFSTSFCGSASSFSGTIGDVHDSWSMPDSTGPEGPETVQRQKHRVRSKVGAIQNFGIHLILTVLLMVFAFWFTTRPSPILLPPKPIHWVSEQGQAEWGGVGDTAAIIGGRKQSHS